MGFLQDFTPFELMVIAGTIILLALLVTEVLDITHLFSMYDSKDCEYGYGIINGESFQKQFLQVVPFK